MHTISKLLQPSTLPQAIVAGAVILGLAGIFIIFIKKAPLYALIVSLAIVFAVVLFGCDDVADAASGIIEAVRQRVEAFS